MCILKMRGSRFYLSQEKGTDLEKEPGKMPEQADGGFILYSGGCGCRCGHCRVTQTHKTLQSDSHNSCIYL